jgi:hypothetical protein
VGRTPAKQLLDVEESGPKVRRTDMRALVLFAGLLIASSASAAGSSSSYTMKGPCRVRTTGGPIAFDETYNPTLKATVSGPDKDLTIEVEGEGMKCTLKGVRVGTAITLPVGQKCPQHIDRDGFKGELEGSLASGKGTLVGKTLTLKTSWDVSGKVKVYFKKLNVKGVVDADVKGNRV